MNTASKPIPRARVVRRSGSQADAVEAFAKRAADAASRIWQEAVRLEALGVDATAAWSRYGAILQRGYILTGLLGAAASYRRQRAQGVAPPVPEQPPVDLRPVTGIGGASEFDAFSLQGVQHAPFWAALDIFRREVPGLQSLFDELARTGQRSVAKVVEKEKQTALPDLRKRVDDAVRQRPAVGASPLVREATPEQLAAAVDATLGVDTAKSRTDTLARTLTMEAFNAGSYQQMTRAGIYEAYRLFEIHDRRTRGNPNPNALYPDTGPHWQMDGFIAAVDDPIWRRIWPPNGYNCRATVVGLTKQECQGLGFWIEDKANPRGGMLDRRKLQQAFAKQRAFVESGQYPDPGFDRNVGAGLV